MIDRLQLPWEWIVTAEHELGCADLRRKVRRLLAMYGYPPDLSEDATQLVLKQAELSTEAGE